ncbi:MAG TPA: hypothetical protein VF590_03900, partial [Isosphaeraceae bacterium]
MSRQSILDWIVCVTSNLLPSQSRTLAVVVAAAVRTERPNLATSGRQLAGPTTATAAIKLCQRYGRRMSVEELFRDQKNRRNGQALRTARICDAASDQLHAGRPLTDGRLTDGRLGDHRGRIEVGMTQLRCGSRGHAIGASMRPDFLGPSLGLPGGPRPGVRCSGRAP